MSEPFLAEIRIFGFNFPPRGWAQCDGQLLQISQFDAVFALLGTVYGGDGRQTFGLPDLRGRTAIHYGSGPGLTTRVLGQKSGTETNTLAEGNLPPHSHPAQLNAAAVNSNQTNPTGMAFGIAREDTYIAATPDQPMAVGSVETLSVGAAQAVNNMQPYLALNCCIALVGLFPPRN